MMTETNVDEFIGSNKNAIIIAVTVVVLFIIFMYYRDRQQYNAFKLRTLEKRVELLEEWGMPRQNVQ